MIRYLLLALVLSTVASAATPTSAEIDQAIADLGSPRFAVREKASKLLWEAGRAGEPALRAAVAAGKDEEIVGRAKPILEKFDWGLYPDTPKPLADEIEKFRGGDETLRLEAITKLAAMRPVPADILRKLTARETEEEPRLALQAVLATESFRAVPELLVAGKPDEARSILDAALFDKMPTTMENLAAFEFLSGKLPEAVKRLEARQAHTALAYLHRARGDWAAARASAAKAKDEELERDIAWVAADWKTLSEKSRVNVDDLDNPAVHAAYHRLAGQADKAKAVYDELKKELAGVEGDDVSASILAEALLLNRRGAEATKLLAERPRDDPTLAFDLLAARFQYKEAFALADKLDKELPNDELGNFNRRRLDVRRSAALAALGDRDGAIQLARKAMDAAIAGNNGALADDLVIALAYGHADLKDLAAECVARWCERPDADDVVSPLGSFLRHLVGDRWVVAQDWWAVLHAADGKGKGVETMRKVLALADGTADLKLADAVAAAATAYRTRDGKLGPVVSSAAAEWATAEAYRSAGALDKAEPYFVKAVAASIAKDHTGAPPATLIQQSYGDFLMQRQRPADAAKAYRAAWEATPSEPLPLFLCGQAMIQTGGKAEGTRLCDVSHWIPLGDDDLRREFSQELAARGFDADSRRELDLALATGWLREPRAFGNCRRAARVASRAGKHEVATTFAEQDAIGLLRSSGRYGTSSAYLLAPELARTHHARALLAAGKLDAAMAEARDGLAQLPGHVDLAIGLVPDLDKAGKKKEADEIYAAVKKTFEAGLAEHPNSPHLLNGLAWMMVNCNRDLELAKKHAAKAVENAPGVPNYIDTLAETHFRLKDRAGAVALMAKCRKLEPRSPYYRKQVERFEKLPFDSDPPDEVTGDD